MSQHILVRHEQGAGHAAEGYARSTGKPGVVLVTSGPGATNMVTPLTDALMDFDPAGLHHRASSDASDRQRRVPGMRHRRHHAALHQAQLAGARRQRSRQGAARGLLCRDNRPAGPGRGRRAEGRAVRHRHLSSAAQVGRAHLLRAAGEGRCRADPQSGGAARQRQAAGDLFGRRRDQFRPRSLEAAARAGRGHRLSDHLDPDGARRLSGLRQELARHARHARHLRSQHDDA